MTQASGLFRLLGDDARLRLLRLLAAERLNVSELTAILGIAQSGVSRHLGLLRDAELVTEEREGGFTYYRVAANGDNRMLHAVWDLLNAQLADAAATDLFRDDETRLREVLRVRRESRETHSAAVDSAGRQIVPGRSWAAWSRALGLLLPSVTVADLGCGEGYLTLEMARWAERVMAVDRSERVLQRARALARRRKVSNIVWKRGEIEQVPLADAAADVAFLSQALHHAEDPPRALREAARVVGPGGRVVVLDLGEHGQTWVRDRLGDRWLGFAPRSLAKMMSGVGLEQVRVGTGLDEDPFGVIIAVGAKPRGTE